MTVGWFAKNLVIPAIYIIYMYQLFCDPSPRRQTWVWMEAGESSQNFFHKNNLQVHFVCLFCSFTNHKECEIYSYHLPTTYLCSLYCSLVYLYSSLKLKPVLSLYRKRLSESSQGFCTIPTLKISPKNSTFFDFQG